MKSRPAGIGVIVQEAGITAVSAFGDGLDGWSVEPKTQRATPQGSVGKWPGGGGGPNMLVKAVTVLILLAVVVIMIVYGIRQSRAQGKTKKPRRR